MYKISDNTESNSNSGIESEDGYVGEISGWETEVFTEKLNLSKGVIDFVSKKISLELLFNTRYKIDFEERYSPSGWCFVRSCPFPDHRDSTPSFHYNKADDRFHCFGCNRSGRAVQFVAYMDCITFSGAAELLSDKFNISTDVYIDEVKNNNVKIDKLLLDFSNYVYIFIKNENTSARVKYAEMITQVLDIYIQKHLPRGTMNEENLTERIQKLKLRLDEFRG